MKNIELEKNYIERLEKLLGKTDIDDDFVTEEEVTLWQHCHTKHYH